MLPRTFRTTRDGEEICASDSSLCDSHENTNFQVNHFVIFTMKKLSFSVNHSKFLGLHLSRWKSSRWPWCEGWQTRLDCLNILVTANVWKLEEKCSISWGIKEDLGSCGFTRFCNDCGDALCSMTALNGFASALSDMKSGESCENPRKYRKSNFSA